MKKIASKYATAAFALIFLFASSYCAVEALAEAVGHIGASHHHHDDGVGEPHDHATPAPSRAHHHGDSNSPTSDDQSTGFCCSQINGIPIQLYDIKPQQRIIFFAREANVAEQTFHFSFCADHRWLIHHKAPPSKPGSFHFYVFIFPPHAPPLSPSA